MPGEQQRLPNAQQGWYAPIDVPQQRIGEAEVFDTDLFSVFSQADCCCDTRSAARINRFVTIERARQQKIPVAGESLPESGI